MRKIPASLAFVVLVAACNKAAPAPAAAPPTPPPVAAGPGAPLSVPDKAALERDFAEARKLVASARDLLTKGEGIERTQGKEAANDTYVAAKTNFRKAAEMTEHWIEPELGKVTKEQVARYLGPYEAERGKWITEAASMGKLHR